MRNEPSSGHVESVARALTLLDLIAEQASLSVTDAAVALGVHQSTAQRLLATLVSGGYARQDERRRYVPGAAMFRLPRQVESARQRLRPYVESLYELVGETVHLATLVGTEVHHPDAIESAHPLRFGLRVGVRLPAHITSEGKSLLAQLPWDEVEARYSLAVSGGRGWDVDFERLRENWQLAREQGYATNFEESEPGIAAYSMAIGALDGEYCALSIAMPIARYTDELGASFVRDLTVTVQAARKRFGLPGTA